MIGLRVHAEGDIRQYLFGFFFAHVQASLQHFKRCRSVAWSKHESHPLQHRFNEVFYQAGVFLDVDATRDEACASDRQVALVELGQYRKALLGEPLAENDVDNGGVDSPVLESLTENK